MQAMSKPGIMYTWVGLRALHSMLDPPTYCASLLSWLGDYHAELASHLIVPTPIVADF